MTEERHWSELIVPFLDAVREETTIGERLEATITIGFLTDRRYWLVMRDDDDYPIVSITDGTEDGTDMIWFHEDFGPVMDELLKVFSAWKQREAGAAPPPGQQAR